MTVTDEEMDALERQFAGLKIEVFKKIYWHQYPDGRLEAIHPNLVRVRKDGTFFMYDEELHESLKPPPAPLPTRPTRAGRGETASRPIIVDQPGASASDPITIKDPGGSVQEPITLGTPGMSVAEPILVGFPGVSASDPIVVDVPGTSAADPIVVHYPGISSSDPIIVDVPGASTSDPNIMDITGAPAASLAPPQATNPIVIKIPEAPEDSMKMTSEVKLKADTSKGKGRIPSQESMPGSDSGSSRASSSPGTSFSPFTPSFAMPAPSSLAIGGTTVANELRVFIAQPGFPPNSYPYEDVPSSLPPGIFDVPEPGTLPVTLPVPDPSVMPTTAGGPAEDLPANSVPPEVLIIDPVETCQPRTLEEELAEFFESIKTYNPPQAQILPQSDGDWDALFAPGVATVYQPIPEVPGATVPAPVPQAQIVVEPQLDPLVQMQTSPPDTWAALYGADTYLELPRMEDIPPPSAWEGAFDPTVQAFLNQLWASDTASDATAPPVADPFAALPSQGFDFFNFV